MAQTDSTQPRRSGASRAALMIVGVLALLGLAYSLARVDILRARIGEVRSQVYQLERNTQALTAQLQSLQSQDAQHQQQLSQVQSTLQEWNIERLAQAAEATQQWHRLEALYLLRLAQQQLQMAHDVVSATTTLNTTLARLSANPEVAPDTVRDQLQQALASLRGLPDTASYINTLALLETQVTTLPLAGETVTTTGDSLPSSGWARAALRLKQALANLIDLRRSGNDASQILDRQAAALDRQYLYQLLLAARLAALRQDQADYQLQLDAALAWLTQKFDISQKPVQSLQAQLQQLKQQNIAPTLPDLSASITAMQTLLPRLPSETAEP